MSSIKIEIEECQAAFEEFFQSKGLEIKHLYVYEDRWVDNIKVNLQLAHTKLFFECKYDKALPLENQLWYTCDMNDVEFNFNDYKKFFDFKMHDQFLIGI